MGSREGCLPGFEQAVQRRCPPATNPAEFLLDMIRWCPSLETAPSLERKEERESGIRWCPSLKTAPPLPSLERREKEERERVRGVERERERESERERERESVCVLSVWWWPIIRFG